MAFQFVDPRRAAIRWSPFVQCHKYGCDKTLQPGDVFVS